MCVHLHPRPMHKIVYDTELFELSLGYGLIDVKLLVSLATLGLTTNHNHFTWDQLHRISLIHRKGLPYLHQQHEPPLPRLMRFKSP